MRLAGHLAKPLESGQAELTDLAAGMTVLVAERLCAANRKDSFGGGASGQAA